MDPGPVYNVMNNNILTCYLAKTIKTKNCLQLLYVSVRASVDHKKKPCKPRKRTSKNS